MASISLSEICRTLGLQNRPGASQKLLYALVFGEGDLEEDSGFDEFIFDRKSEKCCLNSAGAAGCAWRASGAVKQVETSIQESVVQYIPLGHDLFPINFMRGVCARAEQQRREGCMV